MMDKIIDDDNSEILRFEICNDGTGAPTMYLVFNDYPYRSERSISRHVDPYQLLESVKAALTKYESAPSK